MFSRNRIDTFAKGKAHLLLFLFIHLHSQIKKRKKNMQFHSFEITQMFPLCLLSTNFDNKDVEYNLEMEKKAKIVYDHLRTYNGQQQKNSF